MQEPYGAYSWFAVNDQPSDKAFYDFTLRVPAPWTGIANGVMTSREEEDGQTVSEWHLDSKTSSYLVTVAFGDFAQTLDTTSESGVPITAWVPKGEPTQVRAEPRVHAGGTELGGGASSARTPGRRSASWSSTPTAAWRPRR